MLTKLPETLGVVSADTGKRLLSKFGIKRFTMPSFQLRFVIPRVDMTQSSRAKNLHDVGRLCREVSLPTRQWMLRRYRLRREQPIFVQHC